MAVCSVCPVLNDSLWPSAFSFIGHTLKNKVFSRYDGKQVGVFVCIGSMFSYYSQDIILAGLSRRAKCDTLYWNLKTLISPHSCVRMYRNIRYVSLSSALLQKEAGMVHTFATAYDRRSGRKH
ncbi:unnamed protein product [Ixodes pacificus]